MTQQQHPIVPPPELAAKWVAEIYNHPAVPLHSITLQLVERAAQWGADQELEACCALLELSDSNARDFLQSARRPQLLSLKEQALETLQRISKDKYPCNYQEDSDWDTIRRALEQLPDHE
jgi:hypothetical protein